MNMKLTRIKRLVIERINNIEHADIAENEKVNLCEDVILLCLYIDAKLERFGAKSKLSNPMLWRVK